MPDLTTTYLGLRLRNPLVVSASPLSRRIEIVRRMEDAGAGAIVLYSLFEEQISRESLELDHYLNLGTHSYAESLSYFPDLTHYNMGPEPYLDHLHAVKEAAGIPVIASLNGVSSGGWVEYAASLQNAGADALEVNLYYLPTDPDMDSIEVEDMYVRVIKDLRRQVTIPIAVKLSPFFTALPHFARRLVTAGAQGLVLFNRFYQPEFDLETLNVVPHLELSTSQELRLPLRWIAILHGRLKADLALTGGVHTEYDVLKAMMAGAKVAMLTSELLSNGVSRLSTILAHLTQWMEEHEYESIAQMQGSMSQQAVSDPAAFERANYMKVLDSYTKELR